MILALQQLMPLIQRELHRIAVFHMANERPGSHAAADCTRQ
jgi:hypothetical protein